MPGGLVLLLHDHFPTHRPLVSTNPLSSFLLSTLAAEAWRSNAGSAKFQGPVVWFILNTVVVVPNTASP